MGDNNKQPYKDNDYHMAVRLDRYSLKFLEKYLKYKQVTQKDFMNRLLYLELKKSLFLHKNNENMLKLFKQLEDKYALPSDNMTREELIKGIMQMLTFASQTDINFLKELFDTMDKHFKELFEFHKDLVESENEELYQLK